MNAKKNYLEALVSRHFFPGALGGLGGSVFIPAKPGGAHTPGKTCCVRAAFLIFDWP
jgi:hypothetical protein